MRTRPACPTSSDESKRGFDSTPVNQPPGSAIAGMVAPLVDATRAASLTSSVPGDPLGRPGGSQVKDGPTGAAENTSDATRSAASSCIAGIAWL